MLKMICGSTSVNIRETNGVKQNVSTTLKNLQSIKVYIKNKMQNENYFCLFLFFDS